MSTILDRGKSHDRAPARPSALTPTEMRDRVPALGLREYWYPALPDREVGARTPAKVSLLGDDVCLFRGATGAVAAIQDVCPHRGARLSEGDCH